MERKEQYKIFVTGKELVELKRHAHQIPECPGLEKRIQKYKGDKPFLLSLHELDWLVAILDAVLNDPNGYALIEYKTLQIQYVPYSHPGAITCKQLYSRLRKQAEIIHEANMNTRKIELSEDERDLLLQHKYYLSNDFLEKLKRAKNTDGYYTLVVSCLDLENMIGNVSMLSNHEDNPQASMNLNDLAEHLEVYL